MENLFCSQIIVQTAVNSPKFGMLNKMFFVVKIVGWQMQPWKFLLLLLLK
jgi:hypothetical protein